MIALNITIGFLVLTGIIVFILATTGVFTHKSQTPVKKNQSQEPYIKNIPPSTPFKTGYIKNIPPQQKLADLCNKVMYPINPPYVNYGAPYGGEECDVNKFNSPP